MIYAISSTITTVIILYMFFRDNKELYKTSKSFFIKTIAIVTVVALLILFISINIFIYLITLYK